MFKKILCIRRVAIREDIISPNLLTGLISTLAPKAERFA